MDPGIPPDPIGSQGIPLDSTGFHGPRLVQMVDGSFESFWIHCACGPYGSYRISTACCCLIGPRVSLDAGIPPDPIGSQRIPMDSPRFHRPCWVHMVDGSSWVLLDPLCLRARGSYMGPRTLQNFHGLLLSYWTQGVPGCRDPTGSHWIPTDPQGFHVLLPW